MEASNRFLIGRRTENGKAGGPFPGLLSDPPKGRKSYCYPKKNDLIS